MNIVVARMSCTSKEVTDYVALKGQVEKKTNNYHYRIGRIVFCIFEKQLVYFELPGIGKVFYWKMKKFADTSVHGKLISRLLIYMINILILKPDYKFVNTKLVYVKIEIKLI
jgi:hypothetical protein